MTDYRGFGEFPRVMFTVGDSIWVCFLVALLFGLGACFANLTWDYLTLTNWTKQWRALLFVCWFAVFVIQFVVEYWEDMK